MKHTQKSVRHTCRAQCTRGSEHTCVIPTLIKKESGVPASQRPFPGWTATSPQAAAGLAPGVLGRFHPRGALCGQTHAAHAVSPQGETGLLPGAGPSPGLRDALLHTSTCARVPLPLLRGRGWFPIRGCRNGVRLPVVCAPRAGVAGAPGRHDVRRWGR